MASKFFSTAAQVVGVKNFLDSELSAADLARNPNAGLEAAKAIQSELNRYVSKGIDISGLNEIKGSQFQGTTILSEFHNEQQRLQREFVDATIEERFGRQGITSVSSTVNAQGVRTPIGGRGVGATPTSAQRNAIAAEFRTPLVSIAGGGFATSQVPQRLTSAVGSSLANQTRTIVGGAGIQRRRAVGPSTAPTILTSDSDEPQSRRRLGGPTILG
jgi:hypothetical protein